MLNREKDVRVRLIKSIDEFCQRVQQAGLCADVQARCHTDLDRPFNLASIFTIPIQADANGMHSEAAAS